MACVLFGNNFTKPIIGRSKMSQIFKSYAYSHSLKQMFLSQGNAKAEKSQGGLNILETILGQGKE